MRSPRRRPGFSRGWRREAALGGLAPVTLLGLLKHPLLRLGLRDNAARRSLRSSARCCAGRGRAAAAPGFARALEAFGAQLAKFRAKEDGRSARLRSAHAL